MDYLPESTHISDHELVQPNEGMLNLLTTQLKFAQDVAHFLSKQSVELTGKTLLELNAWIEELEKQVREESNALAAAYGCWSDIDDPEGDYILSIMPPPHLDGYLNDRSSFTKYYVVDEDPDADGFFARHLFDEDGNHVRTDRCEALLGPSISVPVDK